MKTLIPSSVQRVPKHTSAAAKSRISKESHRRVRKLRSQPRQIPERLRELDREWDVERALEMNASILALTGSALALTVHRRFAIVPIVIMGFLLQHAIQGWCPPLPILRHLGFRTSQEIERERRQLQDAA